MPGSNLQVEETLSEQKWHKQLIVEGNMNVTLRPDHLGHSVSLLFFCPTLMMHVLHSFQVIASTSFSRDMVRLQKAFDERRQQEGLQSTVIVPAILDTRCSLGRNGPGHYTLHQSFAF